MEAILILIKLTMLFRCSVDLLMYALCEQHAFTVKVCSLCLVMTCLAENALSGAQAEDRGQMHLHEVPKGNLPYLGNGYEIFPLQTPRWRDVAQPGRALRSGRRGRWFKSSRPDQFSPQNPKEAEN